jgi:hypothetical protein
MLILWTLVFGSVVCGGATGVCGEAELLPERPEGAVEGDGEGDTQAIGALTRASRRAQDAQEALDQVVAIDPLAGGEAGQEVSLEGCGGKFIYIAGFLVMLGRWTVPVIRV